MGTQNGSADGGGGVYKVTLSGPGVSLEREVSGEVAGRLMLLVVGGGSIGRGSGWSPAAAGGAAPGAAPAIQEFFRERGPQRNPEKIATIGYYLGAFRGAEAFTRKDISDCFEEARELVPKNLARDVTWAIRIGWISPKGGEKDTYYLTQTGTQVVEQGFSDEIRKKTRLPHGARRKKIPASAPAL